MNIFSALTAGAALIIISLDFALGPLYIYCHNYDCYDFEGKYKVCHQL